MDNPTSDNDEPIAQRNSRANLERILGEMIEQPDGQNLPRQSKIFNIKAVLVLDMTGFSHYPAPRHRLVPAMIHQMH
jgi:hypothetical protein